MTFAGIGLTTCLNFELSAAEHMGIVGHRLFAVTLCAERASAFFKDKLFLMKLLRNNAHGATNASVSALSAAAGMTIPRDLLA